MSRAEAWGVAQGYTAGDGRWVDVPGSTVERMLEAMGASGDKPPGGGPLTPHRGETLVLDGPAVLRTEDGDEHRLAAGTVAVPPDVPFGYHTLTMPDGTDRMLILSPGRCPLPERAWGWAVQLYAARSRESWGMGDLGDLRRLARWSHDELGAGLLLVNPLHAALPGVPQQASPYFPSTRRFVNPLYLRVEDVPGAAELGSEIEPLAVAGRALNADRRIDRDAVYRLKMDALARLWERFPGDPAFDRFVAEGGEDLAGYATFCVLVEDLGRPWAGWDGKYRHPGSADVAQYRARHERRVRFHQWLQWLAVAQLEAAAAGPIVLIEDLAVGVDPAGADAWQWQDVLVHDVSVGAPADEFNTLGQDWGLPPFDPWKLRAANYDPFVRTVRAALRHGGGMRLDHVMGLFRLFWVPRGEGPRAGTYVRYPSRDLLDIVALESHRAGAFVVGEDLGTVEDKVRDELAERNVLSYRLLWFEREAPKAWPVKALAAVTTHDLPTVAGLWTGSDVEAQREAGMKPNEQATAETRERLQAMAGVADNAPVADLVVGAYAALAQTPCLLLTATLDDAIGVEERPNMPGTIDQWPNWSIALPRPIEELEAEDGPRRVAEVLRRAD